jgi:hypothetical protein
VILDVYTARRRALPCPPDAGADAILVQDHAPVAAAIAHVDRLARVLERAVPLRTRLHQLADAAQGAGVRVSIELHRRASPSPEISRRG